MTENTPLSNDVFSHPRVASFLNMLTQDLRYEVIDDDPAIAPRRAHAGDAGLDLAIREDVTVYPGETEYVPSNVKFVLPEGLSVEIQTRSSTFKKRVIVINTLIDRGYTGEVSTVVTNNQSYPVTLKRGERLAQAVVRPYFLFDNEFGATGLPERGERRFGSSDEENHYRLVS